MRRPKIGTVTETHVGYGVWVEQVWLGVRRGWHTSRTWRDSERAKREAT